MASEKKVNAPKLRKYLKDRNISDAMLAHRIGVSKAAISLYLKGSRRPKKIIARRIVAFTKKEIDLGDLGWTEAQENI